MYEALLVGQFGQHGADLLQVQTCHLFVQVLGQHIDLAGLVMPLGVVNSSIWAMVWLAKLEDITKLGWPVPQPRFTKRPLANRMMRLAFLPSGKIDVVHLGLDLFPLALVQRSHVDFVVEVTDVADDGLVLHAPPCARSVMTFLLPVAVTKMSALSAAYSMVTTL